MDKFLGRPAASGASVGDAGNLKAVTIGAVLLNLLQHPVRLLIVRWNWKSAILSSALRAAIFFAVNLAAGWEAAVGAMTAELALRLVTSGFYGALTEAFSAAQPVWKATFVAMIGLPFLNHSLEFLLHWLRHTPILGPSIAASVLFTSLSTAFNLYAMRRGVFTVGGGSQSLQHDLSRIPQLLVAFVCVAPLALVRFIGSLARLR